MSVEVYYPGPKKYYQALRASTGQAPATYSAGVWTTNLAYWAECTPSCSADPYDATKAYIQGNQAYNPDTDCVYQLYAASSTGNPTTDTTRWGVLTPFDRCISFEQPGQTAFDHAFSAWDQDVKNFRNATRQPAQLSQLGVQVAGSLPFVWLKYRIRCPVLTGDLFDASLAYASGDQMYYKSATSRGNFWTANTLTNAGETPEDAPTKWDLVEIPLLFRRYLVHGAAADYLRPEQEQDNADRELALAEAALDQCVNLVFGQQGQDTEVEFLVR